MRPAPIPLLASLLALLLVGAGPAQAQYKWKDARGQVHASDLPPPRDIPDKDVLQRPAAATRPATAVLPAAAASAATAGSAAQGAPRAPVDPELEARRKRADDEARARAKVDEERLVAQRAENCQRARQQAAVLGNGQRLLRFNDKGERVVVDDASRADEAQAVQRVIASECR